MKPFIPLRAAGTGGGAKAVTLGRLIRAGYAVPQGVVLPVEAAAGWERVVPEVLKTLGATQFAVRSSGLREDGSTTLFAGQFHTALNVSAHRVVEEIRRTAAGVNQAREYARAVGMPVPAEVAVIVQRMLVPDVSGVAFSRDPVTGQRTVVIEAVRGLGEGLVSGDKHPEQWRHCSSGAPECSSVPAVLEMEQASAVSRLTTDLEKLLGGPQDVEWAISDGKVWVLQSRPTTGRSSTGAEATPAATPEPTAEVQLASGVPSSPGMAQGRVRHVHNFNDFERFARGEVLVCAATSPAWTPLLARAAAVVTTRGGILSHAAIVAREFGIPAITAVSAASELPDGVLVRVDGTNGTITSQEDS